MDKLPIEEDVEEANHTNEEIILEEVREVGLDQMAQAKTIGN